MDSLESPGDSTSVSFDIGGRTLEAGAPGFEQAVRDAYAARCRPRCLCRPDGVEMYVARLGDGHVVKRMPESGHRHAPGCPSFGLPAEIPGLSRVLGRAIVEPPGSGETSLRLAFSLTRGPGRPPQRRSITAPGKASGTGSGSGSGAGLSLRGLLHYLWDQAGLTRWHPGFAGKRSWALVRRQLLRAADRKFAGASPLPEKLYVPEPFSVEARDRIRALQDAAWSGTASPPGGRQQLMLMIAEVKRILPGRHGFHAVIRHVPDIAFSLDEPLYRRTGRRFVQELAVWGASEGVRMVMGATFGLGAAGTPAIASLCLMPVTRQWLPLETLVELQLIERLIREGRAFRKVLRYDLGRAERIASVALIDRGDPAPLIFA